MNKEKIISWIEDLESMAEQSNNYFIERNNLFIENEQLKEKLEYLKNQKENKNKWFQLIADIGYDYDGCNTVESLKGIIDELVQYALNGRDNDDFEEFILKCNSNE